ncbi:MAG: PAS domain-containing hybrid sensor histidine kinase/response regulator [Bacteroidetes bacterium]|nr:MAG: PAS domain-containing hybrid sensor histidine kinase/response regulator [Bacteroidota bacterium]
MNLSKRFLFVPIILAAFIYLFYSAYQDVKNRTLNDFKSHQTALAKQASRGIESFFIYYQRELQFLSKLEYISDLNDQGRKLLADFYNNHSDQIEAITVVDNNGVLRYTFPYNKAVIGQDISNQEHVKTVIKTHKPTVSDVFTSVQGYRAIAYHFPIISGIEYKGSIAILIYLDKLSKRFIENIKTGETGYACMISEDDINLFNPLTSQTGNSIKETYSSFPSVLDLIDRTLKENEGSSICYVAPTLDSKKEFIKTLVAFYRIPLDNTFWTILIFTPEKEIFGKLTSFRNRMFILFSLVFIVMVVYFSLMFKASSVLKEEKKRKELENVLRESEKRFRIMFELSPAGIILIDENGTIIEVNSSFCETLGYARGELIANNIRLFSSPDRDDEIEKNITEILSGKTLKHEVTNIRKDKTTCVIALYETMIMLPDGKPGILSVSNDITERKRAQLELVAAKEKAEESDRLKSTFLATISHELRTPLNAIIGFSSLLVNNDKDEETATYPNIILESGQHLLSLVDDIFDTTMIETGQIKINYEKTDIVSVLHEVKNIIYGESLRENKARVELILKLDPEMDHKYILTDSRRIKQVLINLLRNALKFTDEGYIEFGLSEIHNVRANSLQFYVKDTGIGINKKHHDVIFKLFRQIDDTHTRRFKGMGIGLSIVKKIIELLGGEIWVESEPGKGSVFNFTIPVISEDNKKAFESGHKAVSTENTFTGRTVLITEDEPSNYNFLRILLTKMNIRVLWAKNGIEAVSICDSDPSINLVLMDIKIPFINGYEATGRIKKKRPDLPVIAQTAYATLVDKEETLKAGCDDYLSKPIKIEQLNDLLRKYL